MESAGCWVPNYRTSYDLDEALRPKAVERVGSSLLEKSTFIRNAHLRLGCFHSNEGQFSEDVQGEDLGASGLPKGKVGVLEARQSGKVAALRLSKDGAVPETEESGASQEMGTLGISKERANLPEVQQLDVIEEVGICQVRHSESQQFDAMETVGALKLSKEKVDIFESQCFLDEVEKVGGFDFSKEQMVVLQAQQTDAGDMLHFFQLPPLELGTPGRDKVGITQFGGTNDGSTQKRVKVMRSSSKAYITQAQVGKLGEKVTALQQLVSPYGKTDTASVLLGAIGYIKFLQEQVHVLSSPYLRPKSNGKTVPDLRSRGLCLVPITCTLDVANSNGADYWISGRR